METEGVLAELDFQHFYDSIGGPYLEIIKKNERSHEVNFLC